MPQNRTQNTADIAADFLTRCFAPGESMALLLRRENPDGILQRIVPLEGAIAPRYLGWLAHENSIGANVYVAANPVHSGSRKRTKESIAAVRHLYLDLGHRWRGPPRFPPGLRCRSHSERNRQHFDRQVSSSLARGWLHSRTAGERPETGCRHLWRLSRVHGLQPRASSAGLPELQVRPRVSGHRRIPRRFHVECR